MSAGHNAQEQSAAPSRQWAIKNKLRQCAESGRRLFTVTGGAFRKGAENGPDERRMTFSLYAPDAGWVSLAGDFNAWSPDDVFLEKSPEGLWERAVTLPPGRYEYKFVVDGMWHNDPRCTIHAPNPFGGENCVVILT